MLHPSLVFASECEDLVIASYDKNLDPQPLGKFPDIPDDLPLAVSDCVHNLRTALDYLVYELAAKDSGAIQKGTQFPIESVKLGKTPDGNPFGFDVLSKRYLRGMLQSHRDAIEALQPYNGNTWTQTLKDISNPDKHRQLTDIVKDAEIYGWLRSDDTGKRLPTGQHIYIDPTHTIQIVLPDRNAPIVSTLFRLQANVVDTINAFNSEFYSDFPD